MHTDLVIVNGQAVVIDQTFFKEVTPNHLRAAVHDDGTVAAVAQSSVDECCVVDSTGRRWFSGVGVHGISCVGIVAHPLGWEVTWMLPPNGAKIARVVLDKSLRPTTTTYQQFPAPFGPTATGFLDVALGTVPIMTDQNRYIQLGGVTFGLSIRRGDWTLGQDVQADRLLVYQHSTGKLFVAWVGYTNLPSRLVVDNRGLPVVLPALRTTPIYFESFAPYSRMYQQPVAPKRPALFGWYTGWGAEKGMHGLPGNCYIHVPKESDAHWLDIETSDGRLIARYVNGEPDGDRASLEQRARQAEGPVPVIGYATRQMLLGGVPNVEIVGFECYQQAFEKPEVFRLRVRGYAESGRRCVLIGQAYLSNKYNTDDPRWAPGILSEALRDYPNVLGIVWFHGPARATGVQEQPELLADCVRSYALFPTGLPKLQEEPEEPKPEPVTDTLPSTGTLKRMQALEHGSTKLELQGDGNLVLSLSGQWLWHSATPALGVTQLVMQGDGHLLFTVEAGEPISLAYTRVNGAVLRVLDGAAAIVAPNGEVLWKVPGQVELPEEEEEEEEEEEQPEAPEIPSNPMSRKPNLTKWFLDHIIRPLFGKGAGRKKTDIFEKEEPVEEPVEEPTEPPKEEPSVEPVRAVSIEEMKQLVLYGHLAPPPPRNPQPFVTAVLQAVNDPRWGLHRRPNGHIGGGVIALNVPAQGKPHQIFDIVAGGTSDTPRPNWLDQTHTMEDGSSFMEFPRAARPPAMPRILVAGTKFILEGGQDFQWRGLTGFDLPVRVASGDLRYLDYAAEEGFNLIRIVVASVYRSHRTLEQGLQMLPTCLLEMAKRKIYAEVVAAVDTREYRMDIHQTRWFLGEVGRICAAYSNTVAEGANEIGHATQQPFLADADFLATLPGMLGVTCSVGSTHGGQEPRWTQGHYVTHHADRDKTPEQNGEIMAEYQRRIGKPIVDDEAKGIGPENRGTSRTNDETYGARQAAAYRRYQLGGVTLHINGGLTANMDDVSPTERRAAKLFIAAMKGH